jgi:hypothetical protein
MKPCLKMQNRAVLGIKSMSRRIKTDEIVSDIADFRLLFVLFSVVIR